MAQIISLSICAMRAKTLGHIFVVALPLLHYKPLVPARFPNPFVTYPRTALAVSALLLAPFVFGIAHFRVGAEADTLLQGDQRNLSSYEKVKKILADKEVVVISMECPGVFSPEGIDAIRQVSDALLQQGGIEDVKSLTHSSRPVRRGFSFEMIPLVPNEHPSPAELAALKDFCLNHPLIRNVIAAPDGRHTLITVTCRRDLKSPSAQETFRGDLERTLAPFRKQGLKFQMLALPLIENEIRTTLRRDISRFLPVAILLLIVILWLTFRSWPVLLVVLLNQVVVIAVLPGVIQAAGFAVSVFSVMLFPLLTGVHLNLLAHVYTSFQRALQQESSPLVAIRTMLRDVFRSSLFASITSAIGMFSLTLSDIRQIREFGLLGMLGMILIFAVTFGPGLSLLLLATTRWNFSTRPRGEPPRASPWSDWIFQTVRRRHGWIICGGVAAILVAAFGIGMTRTDIRAVEFLNRKSPTRQAVEELDRVYGGINVLQLEIDSGANGGLNDPNFLRYVESVEHFAAARPAVSGAYSYAQLMAMMNQIWEGDAPNSYRLPGSSLTLGMFALALKAQNFPFLTALADSQFRTAYVVIRTADMPSNQYLRVIDEIVNEARRIKPSGATVSAARGIHSIIEADRRIIRSQLNTAGFTTVVIGLVLTFLWRSPLLAFCSLLTNAIPAALVVALTGYAGVPLNSITIMVAAVCLGIAVDDSIHFITHWAHERRKGRSSADAIAETLRVKGRPITWTSVILIGIFSVFALFSFPPVVQFGMLSAFAFAVALISVLFFLPALLLGRTRAIGSRVLPGKTESVRQEDGGIDHGGTSSVRSRAQ